MADILSADVDDLDSKSSDNESPTGGKKKGWQKSTQWKGKTKVSSGFGKTSIGIGTRKSTGAPKGFGRKGSTTKGNALKNA